MADEPSQQQAAQLAALARQITGDWPRVVEVWEEFRAAHGYYLRAEIGADPIDFLQEAFWAAIRKGHLKALLVRLNEAGLAGEGLHAAAAPFVGGGFQMQSYVNGQWQPVDAFTGGRRYLEACDHICRISIDGQHSGTGVLIRPTVVATAAHVVEKLVQDRRAIPGSVGRLQVEFYRADDLLSDNDQVVPQAVPASLHHDWLGYYSPKADGEGGTLYAIDSVHGIASDTGPWDLALIRLRQPPRSGLRGQRLLEADPPDVRFGIHVLHHPANPVGATMPMLWSIGSMNQALGAPRPLRWLHDANTARGSSGAPCLDNRWRVVALHQAGSDDLAAKDQRNRAVPIWRWAQQVDSLASDKDPTPYLAYVVDENREQRPVFDRRDLQRRAWRAMTASSALPPTQRIFLVLGEAGSGKTFTGAILGALARKAGCPLATLDARNYASAEAGDFAQQILAAVGAAQAIQWPAGDLTTQLRNVRNDTVPQLGQALEELAQQRPLWLVLDGLEVCDTAAPGVAQVVDGLVGALAQLPHLHLALIGWRSAVQTEHAEVLESAVPTTADVLEHLLMTVAPPGFDPPQPVIAVLSQLVENQLRAQTQGSPYARAVAAADAVRATIGALLTQLAATPPAAAPVASGAHA